MTTPNRYLIQFQHEDEDHFTTDCAFDDGQLLKAAYYMTRIMAQLEHLRQAFIWDTATRETILTLTRPDPTPPTPEEAAKRYKIDSGMGGTFTVKIIGHRAGRVKVQVLTKGWKKKLWLDPDRLTEIS